MLLSQGVCGDAGYGAWYGRRQGALPDSERTIIGVEDRVVDDSVGGVGMREGVLTGAVVVKKRNFRVSEKEE